MHETSKDHSLGGVASRLGVSRTGTIGEAACVVTLHRLLDKRLVGLLINLCLRRVGPERVIEAVCERDHTTEAGSGAAGIERSGKEFLGHDQGEERGMAASQSAASSSWPHAQCFVFVLSKRR